MANLASEAPAAPLAAARRTDGPDPREVREFFEQYKAYVDMDEDAYRARIAEVAAEIQATGTYTHTTDELTVGAKLAWYNHSRCIGKLYWRSLTVRDCRHVTDARGHPRRLLRAPARRPQRRPHQADDHDLRARRPRQARRAPAQRPDRRLRRLPATRTAPWLGDGGALELTELAQSLGWDPERQDRRSTCSR